MGIIASSGNVESPFNLILVMIIGFVIFCIVMIACAIYGIHVHRKRKTADPLSADVGSIFEEDEDEQEEVEQEEAGTFAAEFPDTIFCWEILRLLNGKDGGNRLFSTFISDDDYNTLAAIKVLNLRKKEIRTLKGIEYLTSLARLDCAGNPLAELDLSHNTALQQILCFGNMLEELNLLKNTALVNLYCYSNRLTQLDLSKNIALKTLNCSNNKLTELDFSKNPALTGLHCFSNYMDPDPNVSVPDWQSRWDNAGTSWDGSAFQFFPQNEPPEPPESTEDEGSNDDEQ